MNEKATIIFAHQDNCRENATVRGVRKQAQWNYRPAYSIDAVSTLSRF